MFTRLSILLSLILFLLNSTSFVMADSKSDYDYQYGLYRQSYSEFIVLKKDYLDTSSLDNQQKAMLSAKQSILTRDLSKASLSWYIWDLIDASKIDYPPIKSIFNALAEARQFYLSESDKSKKIITTENLRRFTSEYQVSTERHDRILRYGLIANKIARLVRIQIDAQTSLEDLIPRLPTPLPTTVAARLEELKTMHTSINTLLESLASELKPFDGDENVDADIFYSVRINKMNEILAIQTNWINRLIDLDLNYAVPKD